MQDVSRRSFLTGAATLAALGAIGLAGCSPSGSKGDPESEGSQLKTADETVDTEVLVVGLGASGAMAATAAAQGGAKVLAIDVATAMSGTGNVSTTAPAAFGSKAQAEANPAVQVTVQDAFEYLYPLTHYQENGGLLREMLRCSGIAIDTAVAAGMPFMYANTLVPASAPFKNKVGCIYLVHGEDRAAIWEKMMADAGVETRFGLSAEAALVDDDGKIAGIQCTSNDSVVDIKADKVILCTGGFISNEDMVSEYYAGAKIVSCGQPKAQGVGAKIAMGLGAQMGKNFSTSVNEFGGSNVKASPQNAREADQECSSALRLQILGLPVFDNHGSRFMNEGILNGHAMYSGEPLIRASTYYALCDQAFIDRIKSEPYGNFIDTSEPTNVANTLVDLQLTDIEDAIDEAVTQGWAAKADTVAELADVFGLENLEATMEQYNGYCEAGFDDQFYKDSQYLVAMTKPPYYLIQYNPAGYLTLGGIKTNEKCQALDADNNIVDNLYVAGTDADLWSVPYALGGSANGFCLASGWLAGESAAKASE